MKECPFCGCKILVKTEGYLIYKYTCQNCGRWFVEPRRKLNHELEAEKARDTRLREFLFSQDLSSSVFSASANSKRMCGCVKWREKKSYAL
jgi:hypothetical protein